VDSESMYGGLQRNPDPSDEHTILSSRVEFWSICAYSNKMDLTTVGDCLVCTGYSFRRLNTDSWKERQRRSRIEFYRNQ
jgi:hypothetical protein